jgi:gas vesicle protein
MTDYERFGEYQSSERSFWGMGTTLLLVGLGAGALTALLLAPKTGRQTRKLLRRRYEDTRDAINDRASELRERGSQLFGRARDVASDWSDTAEDMSDRVREFGRTARKRARY